MRALVLAHEPDGTACQIETRLGQRGFSVETHLITAEYDEPNVAAPFPVFEHYDIVVPMGSIRSLTNKAEIDSWIHIELDLLRTSHRRGTPILGVCFGGQLMADALGGRVEQAPATSIGWVEIEPADGCDNPIGGGPWLAWHHDRFHPPPGAEVLASTDHATQLFRIGATVGTQFHPEVDHAHLQGFLEGADDAYLAEHGVDRANLLDETRRREAANIEQCHRLVDWFLDEVAFPTDG